MSYEINDGALNLWHIQFKGNSNSLIGTWTKEALLECDEYRCHEMGFRASIAELVFTQDSVVVIENICLKDRFVKDGEVNGVWWRAVDCRTFEISKGNEKIILDFYGDETKVIYNNNVCTSIEPSNSVKENACKVAFEKAQEDEEVSFTMQYYELAGSFKECIESRSVPEWAYDFLKWF